MNSLTALLFVFNLLYLLRGSVAYTAEEERLGLELLADIEDLFPPRIQGRLYSVSRFSSDSEQSLDLLFLLDSSGSIGESNFLSGKSAIKSFAAVVHTKDEISSFRSRIGLIEFSTYDDTHLEFGLGAHNSLSAVESAVDSIRYDEGSWTNTVRALQLAKDHFHQHDDRYNAQAIWIITDGQSNQGGDPVEYAQLWFKNRGIRVMVAGVGDNINRSELRRMSTSGKYKHFSSFEALENTASLLYQNYVPASRPELSADFFDGYKRK